MMRKIGIIGCGWLGLHLAKHLQPHNKVYATTTSDDKKSQLSTLGFDVTVINFLDVESARDAEAWEYLDVLDSIIITVPFPKQAGINSVLQRFKNISHFIRGYKKQLFLMSSIGIYPQKEMEIEENTFAENLLEPNIVQVENFVKNTFPQVNILRLGGLMGADRVLSKYTPNNLGQVVNHVHFEDVCLIIEKMILQNCSSKTYNVVAPLHPAKHEIIAFQTGVSANPDTKEKPRGRTIQTKLLMAELRYAYKHPDPVQF